MEEAYRMLIDSFLEKKWKSNPYEKMQEIANKNPVQITELIMYALSKLTESVTFIDAAYSFLPIDDWDKIIDYSIELLKTEKNIKIAESAIEYASLQCPNKLQKYFKDIFTLCPNKGSYSENWFCRGATKEVISFLKNLLETESEMTQERFEKICDCLINTQNEEAIAYAYEKIKSKNIASDRWKEYSNELIQDSGYTYESGFKKLYSNSLMHIIFPNDYFNKNVPIWLSKDSHPTWKLNDSTFQMATFGGDAESNCRICSGKNHHILTFNRIPENSVIKSLTELSLCVCLSCLGWEEESLFYLHDEKGNPQHLINDFNPHEPQFPAVSLKQTNVSLVSTPVRWMYQSWGMSNSRENLNRIFGLPTWVQSPQYLSCPKCNKTMSFLLQLDSDIPTSDSHEWLWGSGGICYVFWCDHCWISGYMWQCT